MKRKNDITYCVTNIDGKLAVLRKRPIPLQKDKENKVYLIEIYKNGCYVTYNGNISKTLTFI